MKKHLLKTLLLFTFLFSGLVSCAFFNPEYNSVREYLYQYSNASVPSESEPMGSFAYDKNHNLCIPSDQDYFFRVHMTNPNNETHFDFRTYLPADERGSHDYDEETRNLIEQNKIKFIYDYNTTGPYVFYIQFDKDYLKSKDTEGQRDFLTCILLKAQEWDPGQGENGEYVDKVGPVNTPYPFKFSVNTPPQIISHQTIESLNNNAVLCMAIKKPSAYPEIYSDYTPDANGKYNLKINGTTYYFTINESYGNIYFYNEQGEQLYSFKTSKDSSQIKIQGQPFTVASDEYAVYFQTETPLNSDLSTSPEYTIYAKDSNGLTFQTKASVRPTGKPPLSKPEIILDNTNATATITPNFTDSDGNPVSQVTIYYKTSDFTSYKTLSFNKNQNDNKFVLNLPGGKTTVTAYQSLTNYEDSETETKNSNCSKVIYVNQQTGTEYGGGNSAHPINSLTQAGKLISAKTANFTQDETWDIILQSDIIAPEDFPATDNLFQLTKTSSSPLLTVNIKSADTNKKTIDINKFSSDNDGVYGRPILTRYISLNLTDLIIQGGNIKNGQNAYYAFGGGISADNTDLSLTNCIVQSNKVLFKGGGIFCNKTLTLTNTTVIDNISSYGGGIYFAGPTLSISSSTIGKKDHPNKSTYGGGINCDNSSDSVNFTIQNSSISYNTTNNTTCHGGGIFLTKGLLNINSCTIDHNIGTNGGGLQIEKGICNIYGDTSINSNEVSDNGGGIYAGNTLNDDNPPSVFISGNTIIGSSSSTNATDTDCSNKAYNGGGIYSERAKIYIGYTTSSSTDNNFSGYIGYNYASNFGGGIFIKGYRDKNGEVHLYKGSITNNCAYKYGGGVFISASTPSEFYITNASMTGNIAYNKDNVAVAGGAVFIDDSYSNPTKGQFIPNGTVSIVSSAKNNNDVYVPQHSGINVTNSISSSSITITPESYDRTTSLLRDGDNTSFIAKIPAFSVTKNENTNYYLRGDGILSKIQAAASYSSENPPTSGTIGVSTREEINRISGWIFNKDADLSGVTIKLETDITLSSTASVAQIGRGGKPYKGTFDGQNHTILYNNYYEPLFNKTYKATIKNLKFTGAITSSSERCAAAIEYMEGGLLLNCTSQCTITNNREDTAPRVGGFVAWATGTTNNGVKTRDCIIDGCINKYPVKQTKPLMAFVGGIVGLASACEIRNCAQRNTVEGYYLVGGIAGITSGNASDNYGCHIHNCYTCGNITGKAYHDSSASKPYICRIGGITAGHPASYSSYKDEICNCYYYGRITEPGIPDGASVNDCDYTSGAFFGYPCSETNIGAEFTNCYTIKVGGSVSSFCGGNYTPASMSSYISEDTTFIKNKISYFNNWANSYVTIGGSHPYKTWQVSGNIIIFSDE